MKHLFYLLILFLSLSSTGQHYQSMDYLFPINPGQQNYLAGTVGEIRGSHFHTGIDVKTGGRTGLPVHAVVDGYVTRIKVSAWGYGYVLYMKHPNGTFSVYAHLEAFDTRITDWTLKQQYKKESFEVDLFPDVGQFTFKKGDIIGYSGNTGSSSGPHLHFEIRDANHQPIDVLSLGFAEIQDNLPPIVQKVAFITLSEDARVNGYFGRYEFNLTKTGNEFRLKKPISLKGKIGIEIYSYDPMNGVPNKNGVTRTTLSIDDRTYFEEVKKSFNFGKQRNVLVHYNYPAYKKGSKRFNRLYLADGNEHTIYSKVNRGVSFNGQKEIKIETADSYNNVSITSIQLGDYIIEKAPRLNKPDVIGNFLHFKSNQQGAILLENWKSIEPYKTVNEYSYYLWDLRKGIPNGLFINGETIQTGLVSVIPSRQNTSYEQAEFSIDFTHRTLFDTLYLAFEKRYNSAKDIELFEFKNATQPMRSNMTISLKPETKYSEKAKVFSVFGSRYNFIGGEWDDGEIVFKTRDLVTYTILEDSTAPTIEPRVLNADDLKFKISDQLSGIKSYRATIDGEFVLMYYEPKRKRIWSKKYNKNIPFRGEFILEVIDQSDNKSTFRKTL